MRLLVRLVLRTGGIRGDPPTRCSAPIDACMSAHPRRIVDHTVTSTAASSPPTGSLHVACIMDGNGRWAGRRGLARTAGHTEGEENLARLVRVAVKRDIGWLTVFGFSTENW